MFQNISEEIEEDQNTSVTQKNNTKWKQVLKNMLKPQNTVLYVVALLASTISIINGHAPFGIAIFAAACSNGFVAFPIYIATLIGTYIGFGNSGLLNYLLESLIFLGLMLMIKPKYQIEDRNEKKKLGMHLMSAIFLVQALQIFSLSFTVGQALETILQCIITYIFYKIFVNSIQVIGNIGTSKIFSAEEAIGAYLLIAISICAIGAIDILGFSVRNILCILLVLLLAWRNGALIGTTAGVSISVILTMLGYGETTLIALYAISGMIAGILGKVGKIGIILAIVLGFAVVTFVDNIPYLNYIKEILIAAVALLVIPKNISINIEDIIGRTKLLPVTKGNRLTENKEAVYKLNTMSKTIDEIAKSYDEAAATLSEVNYDYIEKNKEIFEEDLKINLETISENMLYEDLTDEENGIVDDIFDLLIEKDEIQQEDLINIFEKHNSYIMGVEDKDAQREIEKQIYQVVKTINNTFQVSKVKFIWMKKVSQNSKIVSEQLENVSKVINNIAKDINSGKEEKELKQSQYHLNIGISRTTKNDSNISGDTSTQLKLKDGKYLLAISDGMGSGEKARKSSKKVINMLEDLLSSGFKKEESIKLINSALYTDIENEMYSTLDISIIDLSNGNIELIKSGACPTYIKTDNEVQVIRESSIPAGMASKIDTVSFDRDLSDGDIVVMCSDGIIDSSGKTDENWLKNILYEIQTDNVQKIADIIIREAIDNGLGIAKDDMTIIVAKIELS